MKRSDVSIRIATIISFLTLILIGCLQNKINTATPISEFSNNMINNECIPPLESFVYSSNIEPNKPIPGKTLNVLPTSWSSQSDLPILAERTTNYLEALPPTSLLLTREKDGNLEVWVGKKSDFSYSNEEENTYQYWVYRPKEQIWETISARVNNSNLIVDKLFISNSGDIWGQNFWDVRKYPQEQPLLSKFNEGTRSFDLVEGTEEVPTFWNDGYANYYWSEVILDTNDVFWIFSHKDALYSYSIYERDIRVAVKLPEIIITASVINDNKILFQDLFDSGVINQERKLYIYSTDIGKISYLNVLLEPWPLYTNILVDHLGRIWFGSAGWYDSNENWFILRQPEIFITNISYDNYRTRWAAPVIVLESSDGRYWFRSYNGMAWLDLEKEQWCWFTTYQSNIVEDSDRNLWMIADNKLYKLPLGEQ